MTSENFPASLSELPAALEWVRGQLSKTTLPDAEKTRMELAMEEAIVNVIHHSGASEFSLAARLQEGRQIELELVDAGPSFNPLTKPLPENGDPPLEQQAPGGKGLILMKKCSDALLYRREDERNILTVIKKLELSLSPIFEMIASVSITSIKKC
jgi:anti-sigma regulatory factor (Ser/Thr protein kinase)